MTPSQKSAGSAPSLRRAFSTIDCPACTLEQTFALAVRYHIDAVELRALGGEVDLPVYFARTYGSPAALAQAVRDQPVRIAALDTSMDRNHRPSRPSGPRT